jgi:hypothetical protein
LSASSSGSIIDEVIIALGGDGWLAKVAASTNINESA